MASRLSLHVYKSSAVHRFEISQTTTIKEIVDKLNCNPSEIVVFTRIPNDSTATPILNLNLNFVDINMWYESPIEITIHNKSDTANYNEERYNMYNQ